MAVEGSIAALIRSFLRDEREVRRAVDRLWDAHGPAARASFSRAWALGGDRTHYIFEWEALLLAVGSQTRYEDLQEFFSRLLAGARPEVEDGDYEGEESELEAALEEPLPAAPSPTESFSEED